jgi:hypothetical protein
LTNKYIKVFGKLLLYFAIVFGLAVSLRSGLWYGIKAGLEGGILFSGTVYIIYAITNYVSGNRLPPDALDVIQHRDVQVNGTAADLFQKRADVLTRINFIKKASIRKDGLRISAKTKATWASFGENIEVKFETIEPDMVDLHISSYPSLRTTIFNFGKSYKNIEKISRAINDASKATQT